MQVRGREFDLGVFVLTGAQLRREHGATMHRLEISEGKLVAALIVLGYFVAFGEMPFAELGPAVLRNVLRPDKLLGVLESAFL